MSGNGQYSTCLQLGPDCPPEGSIYGYLPSLGANGFFVAFFAVFFCLNLGLGVWFKTWTYAVFMCLACATEAIGYGGRIMLHSNPYDNTGFIIQICCLIIGPAFNSGAIYVTLKYITLTFGAEWSRIKPYLYTWIFVIGDLIALTLQAVGGAMASSADNDLKTLKNGDNISMAGISWQVFTLFVFGVTAADYVIRRKRASVPLTAQATVTLRDTKFRTFALAITVAWLTIFIRCVYRIIEFAQGWGNPIMRDQGSFIALEGVMIVIATTCQTIPHPGYTFPVISSQRKPVPIAEPKMLATPNTSSDEALAAEPKTEAVQVGAGAV